MAESRPSTPRTRALLGGMLLAGGLALALRAGAQWEQDAFVRSPVNDARVYWQWAGAIASGHVVGDTPFFSAPLYPYLLGLLRALQGGIAALLALQIALHLATAALLFRIARRWLSERASLLAPACYLLFADAAYPTLRVLACTLGAFLVAWLWERLLALREEVGPLRVATAALALGINVLVNPVMLFAIPLVAAWTWWIAGRRLAPALGLVAVALACVAPATLHNWLASREFIPVSAQAGVTFVHGNAPGAIGVYHAIPGVSSDRGRQNLDARELVRSETDGSWAATDRAFFRRGLAFWGAEPLAASKLVFTKAWWFLSARNYGDIYLPELEARGGLDPWWWTSPLPTAWFTLPALLALFLGWRDGRRVFPELLLLGVPFVTVLLFWYSPRYRFPALPLLAVFGAQAIAMLLAQRARDTRGALVALAFLVSVLSGELNRRLDFDVLETQRSAHEHALGAALSAEGRLEEALEHQRAAAALGDAESTVSAGDLERRLGRLADAERELRAAVAAHPESAYAHKSLAIVFAQSGALDAARAEFGAALALSPNDAETLSGLGNVLLQQGNAQGAVDEQRAAIARNPRYANAHYALGQALQALKDREGARASFEDAARIDPGFAPAWQALSTLALASGDASEAARALRVGLAARPGDANLRRALAWLLATSADEHVRDAATALALASELVRESASGDASLLDLHAAALAAAGRFAEAAQEAARSEELLRAAHAPAESVDAVHARAELYRKGQRYVQPR